MAKFKIKLQSISDIITNSSSETFVVETTNETAKEVFLEELKTVLKNLPKWDSKYTWEQWRVLDWEVKRKFCYQSGDGGRLVVRDWKDEFEFFKENYVAENKRNRATPEHWSLMCKKELPELKKSLWVTIDYGYQPLIDYLVKNYFITEDDCFDALYYGEKDPVTGRILRIIGAEEYKKLPDERKAFKEWYGGD